MSAHVETRCRWATQRSGKVTAPPGFAYRCTQTLDNPRHVHTPDWSEAVAVDEYGNAADSGREQG
jgi:hypothetical protein